MALTRDFKETVAARVQSDPAFAQALLDEAITLFIDGEPDTACMIKHSTRFCRREQKYFRLDQWLPDKTAAPCQPLRSALSGRRQSSPSSRRGDHLGRECKTHRRATPV